MTRRDEARQYYLDHPSLTLRDTSEALDIPFNTIRDWSAEDRWSVVRNLRVLQEELSGDVLDQANAIRLVLFSRILEPTLESGQMASLVKAWMSMLSIGKKKEGDTERVDRDALDRAIAEMQIQQRE